MKNSQEIYKSLFPHGPCASLFGNKHVTWLIIIQDDVNEYSFRFLFNFIFSSLAGNVQQSQFDGLICRAATRVSSWMHINGAMLGWVVAAEHVVGAYVYM